VGAEAEVGKGMIVISLLIPYWKVKRLRLLNDISLLIPYWKVKRLRLLNDIWVQESYIYRGRRRARTVVPVRQIQLSSK
jgi:hypothetical protein